MAPFALTFEVPEVASPRIGLRPATGQAHGSIGLMVTRKDALRGRAQDALHARRDLDLPAAYKGLLNQPGYRVRLGGIEVGAPG
jgi:hypothetical protein